MALSRIRANRGLKLVSNSIPSRRYSSLPVSRRKFGIAFDIDGVLLKGDTPLAGAHEALEKLYISGACQPWVPFIFLTNGGGVTESKKASQLSKLLGVNLSSHQVVLGHSPFQHLVASFREKQVLAVGKHEPANVMSAYGYRNVISIEDYVCLYDSIDPLYRYKPWAKQCTYDLCRKNEMTIQAVFVVSDPLDWGRDIQVICDVLRGGGNPLRASGPQPPLFFAADDFTYQAAFPMPRFGMGAFRIALENVFIRLTGSKLLYNSYGKPRVVVYKYAEEALTKIENMLSYTEGNSLSEQETHAFETIYMIGDNPETDIRGAKEAGKPWFSILVQTGCFQDKEDDAFYSADKVVKDVEEAIDFILTRESSIAMAKQS